LHEDTPAVNKKLLKKVNLIAKSSTPSVHLGISKEIAIVRRLASPYMVKNLASKGI